jgi:hypothetical protein
MDEKWVDVLDIVVTNGGFCELRNEPSVSIKGNFMAD